MPRGGDLPPSATESAWTPSALAAQPGESVATRSGRGVELAVNLTPPPHTNARTRGRHRCSSSVECRSPWTQALAQPLPVERAAVAGNVHTSHTKICHIERVASALPRAYPLRPAQLYAVKFSRAGESATWKAPESEVRGVSRSGMAAGLMRLARAASESRNRYTGGRAEICASPRGDSGPVAQRLRVILCGEQ